MKKHRNDHLRAVFLTVALLAMVSPATGAEPQVDQTVLAQQILGDDEDALVEAIRAIRNISPEDLSPELHTAILEKIRRNANYYAQRDAAMQRSNEWIEPLGTERLESIVQMFPLVAALRDPDTIPALIIGINSTVAREALAEFVEEAVPALLDAVMSGNSPDRRVTGSLVALRFMVEGAAPRPLSAETRGQIRRAAEHHLTAGTDRSGVTLRRASDLAFALDDPGYGGSREPRNGSRRDRRLGGSPRICRASAAAPPGPSRGGRASTSAQGPGCGLGKETELTGVGRISKISGVEIEVCARCGRSVKVISCIEGQDIIDRILAHLRHKKQDIPTLPLLTPPPRAPPETLPLFAGKDFSSTAFNQQGRH